MKPTICLASKSKSRRDVLDGAHVRFEILPSSIKEVYEGEVVDEYVAKLARLKGEDVIDSTSAEIVVSADSVTVLEGEIIEKPKNEAEAIEMLLKLQGRTHIFYTGLYVAKSNTRQVLIRIITTRVTFSSLTVDLIKDYVERFQPFTFAGGYDNSISSWFIDRIDGSISNLMGLKNWDLIGFNLLRHHNKCQYL
ncbi:MAG: Maf family protein [Candidatus Kariarchaeaceae archaeon]|jgi:septum formation protein